MTFILTGTATDLDLDTESLPTLTIQARIPVVIDGETVRVPDARGGFHDGQVVKRGTQDPWEIAVPEGTPLWLTSSSYRAIPAVAFDAPADGETVDLAALLALVPIPAPSPSAPYVKGDKGDPGADGLDGAGVLQDPTTSRLYWNGA